MKHPTPLAETDRQGIAKIEDVRKLDDGRIGAHVTIADPVNHPHEVNVVLDLRPGKWPLAAR